jgi:predicted ATPase
MHWPTQLARLRCLPGDLSAAQEAVAMLLDESAKNGLIFWQVRGRCLNGAVQIKQGDAAEGLRMTRTALAEPRQTEFILGFTEFAGALVEGFLGTGQVSQAVVAIDEALEHAERNEERWCLAELLRVKGELLLIQRLQNAAGTAEDLFLEALGWARRQGALSWELRAATSLARLWRGEGRTGDARELFFPVIVVSARGSRPLISGQPKHWPTTCDEGKASEWG